MPALMTEEDEAVLFWCNRAWEVCQLFKDAEMGTTAYWLRNLALQQCSGALDCLTPSGDGGTYFNRALEGHMPFDPADCN